MKYYVSCGSVNVVIARKDIKTPLQAATEVALSFFNSKSKLDNIVNISELGFGEHEGDFIIPLKKVMKKAGFEDV